MPLVVEEPRPAQVKHGRGAASMIGDCSRGWWLQLQRCGLRWAGWCVWRWRTPREIWAKAGFLGFRDSFTKQLLNVVFLPFQQLQEALMPHWV